MTSLWADIIIIQILQMEKLKQREVKHLAQSYTSNKWGTIQVDTVNRHPILPTMVAISLWGRERRQILTLFTNLHKSDFYDNLLL